MSTSKRSRKPKRPLFRHGSITSPKLSSKKGESESEFKKRMLGLGWTNLDKVGLHMGSEPGVYHAGPDKAKCLYCTRDQRRNKGKRAGSGEDAGPGATSNPDQQEQPGTPPLAAQTDNDGESGNTPKPGADESSDTRGSADVVVYEADDKKIKVFSTGRIDTSLKGRALRKRIQSLTKELQPKLSDKDGDDPNGKSPWEYFQDGATEVPGRS